MTRVEVSVELTPSARVAQLGAIFDLAPSSRHVNAWDVELDLAGHDWQVGLVVGPSGSGKTQLARALWPDALVDDQPWSADRALVDDFPETMGIKEIADLLHAVGLGSIPAWVRPYRTLSNGEAFRAGLARALAERDGLVVIDEFTSVVDRQVAKVASHALQKTVRRRPGRQVIAVTCHYDVLDWLQPDWVYDTVGARLIWRSLQRHPAVELAVHPVDRSVWPVFRPHHYLSGNLIGSAHCYGGFIDDRCVAFAANYKFPHAHANDIMMAHRLVVLPDWQGLSLGFVLANALGQHYAARGLRYRYVVAHPAVIAYCRRSPRWRTVREKTHLVSGALSVSTLRTKQSNPRRLNLHRFEYVPTAPIRVQASPD